MKAGYRSLNLYRHASICGTESRSPFDHFAEWFSTDAKSARIRGDFEETFP